VQERSAEHHRIQEPGDPATLKIFRIIYQAIKKWKTSNKEGRAEKPDDKGVLIMQLLFLFPAENL